MTRDPDPTTQNGRVLNWLRSHPGASFVECYRAMDPPIANIRARHSDLRLTFGFTIVCALRPDGFEGFAVVEEEAQRTLGLNVA